MAAMRALRAFTASPFGRAPTTPIARPMVFGGASCHPERDGHMCDHAAVARPPEHGRMADGADLEDAGDVLFDDFESLDWPAIRAPGGAA